MKVVLNNFNLSYKPVRLLQLFFDELSDGYNVEMLIKYLFKNQFKTFLLTFLDLMNHLYYNLLNLENFA